MSTRRTLVVAPGALAAARPGGALAAIGIGPSLAAAAPDPVRLPADFGAHRDSRIEWWYVTGALDAIAPPTRGAVGFQITFFRASTGVGAAASASRFAARELVFAHAAVTDLEARRLRHDQRAARSGFGVADASTAATTDIVLRDWSLRRAGAAAPRPSERTRAGERTVAEHAPAAREPTDRTATGVGAASRYRARAASESAGFAFDLVLDATQPVLLQGDRGLSRKGPAPAQTSRYYSEPQLDVRGTLALDGRTMPVAGRAWLDHEWSDSFLDRSAVGWDWIGINLDDGGALTAFRLRRADGSTLWTGGSHRAGTAAATARDFADGTVAFTPLRVWPSAASGARYPVEQRVDTPAGVFTVRALLDDQELDSRASTGAIYWEGLSLLLDADGRRVGRGYLEMTGYASRLVL